jgi:ribonuclease D
MKYSYIANDDQLKKFRNHLDRDNIKVVSMDFEGEFNLHRYGETLCLIQVFDGAEFFVIDPFSISAGELTKTLEGNFVKLFFGAGSDRALVYNQYKIKIRSLFDISILIDVLQHPAKSLSSALNEVLGVETKGKKKYQMYNWTIRPIAEDAIQYALTDVRYLFDLKDALLDKIKSRDLVETLAYRLTEPEYNYERKSIPGVKKKDRYKKLSRPDKAVFDVVFLVRDAIAKELDRPPNYILSNDQLFLIARRDMSRSDIRFGKTVTIAMKERIGQAVNAALSRE